MPLVEYLFTSANPQPAKAFLAAQGRIANQLRLPLGPHPVAPSPELLRLGT